MNTRISIVLNGQFFEETKNTSIIARPFDIVIKPYQTLHENLYSEHGAKIFSIQIDNMLSSKLFDDKNPIKWAWMQGKNSCHLAIKILNAVKYNDQNSLNNSIIEAISMSPSVDIGLQRPHKLNTELDALRGQIQDQPDQTINIIDFANQIGLHPVHLARIYKNRFGLSMQDDRQLMRI